MSIQKLLAASSNVVMVAGAIAIWQPASAADPSTTIAQTTNQQLSVKGLATQLKKIGAKMYGAYWCPHCTDQKEMFGQASSQINYIECDPRGQNPQPNLCQKAGIQGYPTWEINGKLYPGVQPLQNLARLSGYQK
jgi:glutaredoxin